MNVLLPKDWDSMISSGIFISTFGSTLGGSGVGSYAPEELAVPGRLAKGFVDPPLKRELFGLELSVVVFVAGAG